MIDHLRELTAERLQPPDAHRHFGLKRLRPRSGSSDSARIPAAALVAAVGTAGFLLRLLAWPPAQSPDAWAYLSWGGALLHADQPPIDATGTAPKPLGTLLGALVWPLPPERAFGILIAISLGVLFGALFAATERRAGAGAGLVAVAVLLPLSRAADVLPFAYIDVLIAALVAFAFAVRGTWRIAALVVAGLARPEAWLVAGVAGFAESRGRLPRRLAAAAAASIAAPLVWIAFDLAVSGDPLLSIHRVRELHEIRGLEPASWWSAGADALHSLPGGPAVALALFAGGLVGLALHGRGRWQARDVLLPLATVVIWAAALALETRRGLGINHRYLLPVLVPLALGVGLLAARFLPARLAHSKASGAVAAGAVAACAATLGLSPAPTRPTGLSRAVPETTLPAVERISPCGSVVFAVAGRLSPASGVSSRRPRARLVTSCLSIRR